MKSSTHASRELIHFVKYGYTVIAAMKSLQLQNKDEAPSDMDQSMNDNQKSAYLDELVNKIITQFVLSDAENPQFILINMKSKKAYLIPVQDAKEKNTNEDSQDAHKNSHQMVLWERCIGKVVPLRENDIENPSDEINGQDVEDNKTEQDNILNYSKRV